MVMYSWLHTQEIKVLNKRKLVELENNKELEFHGLITDELEVDLTEWNDRRLYGYWYDNTVAILRALAECIEGYAEFIFDDIFHFRIYFEDGKVYIKSPGEVDWDKLGKEYFD